MVVVCVQAHEIGGWKHKDDDSTLSYKQRLALFEKQPDKAPITSSAHKTPSGSFSSIKTLTAGLNLRITSLSAIQSEVVNRCKVA